MARYVQRLFFFQLKKTRNLRTFWIKVHIKYKMKIYVNLKIKIKIKWWQILLIILTIYFILTNDLNTVIEIISLLK